MLRDLIITFKETNIILNHMFRVALRRAHNYVASDLRYAYARSYRINYHFYIYLNFQ